MNRAQPTQASSLPGMAAVLFLLAGGAIIGAIVAHRAGPRDGSGLLAGMLIIPVAIVSAYILIEVLRNATGRDVARKLPEEGVAEAALDANERGYRRLSILFLPTVPIVSAVGGWFVSNTSHWFGVGVFAALGAVFGIVAYTLSQFGILPRLRD